jgi:hypothetical protein
MFIWFWYWGDANSWSDQKLLLLLKFSGKFVYHWNYLFLKCLVELTSEVIGAWSFVYGKALNY